MDSPQNPKDKETAWHRNAEFGRTCSTAFWEEYSSGERFKGNNNDTLLKLANKLFPEVPIEVREKLVIFTACEVALVLQMIGAPVVVTVEDEAVYNMGMKKEDMN